MHTGQIVELGQRTLLEVFRIGGPVLAIAIAVSLIVNVIQVLTSLQDQTLSTVPRLLGAAAGIFVLMPWMWRQMAQFTIQMFSDLGTYAR
ncbi:MAG TPA: flagellar biosynthetic protein FliQ [Terriglobales bacterium]|jgi:flagellar biosynthesis protein FliQ|nr:flagellar biosynthetic protein FliQ [Terriglobales bacterium]